jgi:hypothetical protein
MVETSADTDYIAAITRDIRPWLDKIDKVREVIGND